MQYLAGAVLPRRARLPRLDRGCVLPHCPTLPTTFSASSSHHDCSSGEKRTTRFQWQHRAPWIKKLNRAELAFVDLMFLTGGSSGHDQILPNYYWLGENDPITDTTNVPLISHILRIQL